MNSINSTNSISIAPCGDSKLKRLCSEYSDMLSCCNAVVSRSTRFRDRSKIMWGKADCLDLFEFKNELLKTKHFKFKAASWCMFPVLKKGDVLKVKSVRAEDIKIGDIPVYRGSDRLYAHRIVDKQIIDGKEYVITKADRSRDIGDIERGEKIPREEILGIIKEVKRGGKIFSTEKRKMTIWTRFLYKKAIILLKLKTLLEIILETILTKIQSFKFYKVLAKKLTENMKLRLNFELALPFFNEKLNRVYNYLSLKENKKIDFYKFKKANIFHLVMKFNNIPIGCVSFLNRPRSCPYKGFWICDVYIRFRYREMGFNLILLKKAKEILKKIENKDEINEQKYTPL